MRCSCKTCLVYKSTFRKKTDLVYTKTERQKLLDMLGIVENESFMKTMALLDITHEQPDSIDP